MQLVHHYHLKYSTFSTHNKVENGKLDKFRITRNYRIAKIIIIYDMSESALKSHFSCPLANKRVHLLRA